MNSKESEYRELFLAEALENFEELNKYFTILEKDPKNSRAIDAIFRITHTLKGNAMGMGFDDIADLSHVMEDVMGAIKEGKVDLDEDFFEALFRANDKLGGLIKALETDKKVAYLGIKTKLAILLKNTLKEPGSAEESTESSDPVETSDLAESSVNESPEIVEAPPTEDDQESSSITFTEVIQIPVKRMDELLNQVGQLMIERDRLIAHYNQENQRSSQFESLQRITSNLQYSVMNMRMVQVGFLFNKFHRIVRDAANIEKKKVDLELKGTDVELDRNILKIISDALVHLVRNAVSHGIESNDQRKLKGKPVQGKITLNARYEKDNVVIMISDDGAGIDVSSIRKKIVTKGLVSANVAEDLSEGEVIQYIFQSGFSNRDEVTEISGRGVGMDVVKKAVDSIGGQIKVDTEIDKGTTVNLILPSSLALKGALLFELQNQEYAIPLTHTEAVISLTKTDLHRMGDGLVATYLDSSISIIFLKDLVEMQKLSGIKDKGALFKTYNEWPDENPLNIIVVSHSGKMIGIVVDRLLQQKEIIEKTLSKPLNNLKLLSGTTILGNGNVCLVVDVAAISDLLFTSMVNKN